MADEGAIFNIPQHAPIQAPNLLGMAGSFAQTQNALNQNALFQQTFAARKAIGPIMQQSIGADGQIDYNKAAVLLSTHPEAAFMAPDIINGWVQRQNVQADTVLKSLDAAGKRADAMAQAATGLVERGHAGQSYFDPKTKTPVIDAIDQKHLISTVNSMDETHRITPEEKLQFLTRAGIDQKTGQYNPRQAYQDLLQFGVQQSGFKNMLDTTTAAVVNPYGGGTQHLQQNRMRGTLQPMAGGTIPNTPTPAEMNAPQEGIDPATGKKTVQGAFVRPMVTGSGAQAPGTGGMPPAALPSAPSVGGAPGAPAANSSAPSPAAGASPAPGSTARVTALGPAQEEALKAVGPYLKETNDAAHFATNANQVIGEMQKARQGFKTGGGASALIEAARLAQATGLVSQSTVDKIAGGNLGDAQEFGKLSLQLAVAMLKQQLSTGKLTNLEFDTFKQNNPNYETDPRAIGKIFDFMGKMNNIATARQALFSKAYDSANRGGPLPGGISDLSQFEPWFNGQIAKHNQISPATRKTLGIPD